MGICFGIVGKEELMIDTHSHIYGAEFDDDRDEVISRALASGVEKILLPNFSD